jgi:hypothetical protein
MRYIYDDGGRKAAGYKGFTGDCCVRAFAIASGRPYQEIYDLVNELAAKERGKKRSNARTGVHSKTAHRLAYEIAPDWWKIECGGQRGFWTPTMKIGQGCKVHLTEDELPEGRLVVRVSKHYTAVIDGVIHDTHNPQRTTIETCGGVERQYERCVYGYWTF